jgi:hypothetical protein
MRFETKGGLLADGAQLLPARELAALTTVTVGPARERLRFRRQPDGSVKCIADGSFEPSRRADALILRDFDGAWFVSDSSGELRRRSEVDVGTIRMLFGSFATRTPGSMISGGTWATSVVGSEIPPGSYLAIVKDAPFVPALGLDVRWVDSDHVVLGMLSEADVDG